MKTLRRLSLIMVAVVIVFACTRAPKETDAGNSTVVYRGTPSTVLTTVEEEVVEQEEPNGEPVVEAEHFTTTSKWVNCSGLNVRYAPDGDVKYTAPLGEELQVIKHHDNGWTSIHKDGGVYYVSTQYLSDEKVEPAPQPKMTLWKPNVKLTYYHARGLDAHGNKLDPNFTVASNVLPQYTKLYIEGIGYRTVMDTGSKVLNDGRVDICSPTYNNRDCLRYASGMPQRANVYIVHE